MIRVLIVYLLFFIIVAANPTVKERKSWFFNKSDTSVTSNPSNLKYFKFYDAMPDEISLKVFDNIDLRSIGDKKLFVGYGIVDPEGENCKIFRKSDTGMTNDIRVCLPWWRIEREYLNNSDTTNTLTKNLIKDLRKNTRPPINVKTCKRYESRKIYQGGKVTCTSYFSRTAHESCVNNPKQSKCFVSNCGEELRSKCTKIKTVIGEVTKLKGITINGDSYGEKVTKVGLSTHQYECPSGPLFEGDKCVEEETSLMFPYKCSEDSVDPSSSVKTYGEYIYCNESSPIFDTANKITGFNGTCSDGRKVICETNRFKSTTKVCKEPIYETKINSDINTVKQKRTHRDVVVSVLSGEIDSYSEKAECLRSNSA